MSTSNESLQALSESMAAAVQEGGKSTVTVNARRRFPASGVAFEADLVITASHVIEFEDDIKVVLPDGSEANASLLGRDANSDLALLKLDKAKVEPAKVVAEKAQVGQIVLALGRPSENGIQASFGIVSAALGPMQLRHGGFMEAHIRTDAIPYPGFSGGPLVDGEGQVLGINTSGIGRGRSVTIPAEKAWKIAAALQAHGSVKRGFLGIRGQIVELPEDSQKLIGREQASGILLIELEKDSPSAESDLKVSDIVVGFNGEAVEKHEHLMALLNGDVVGKNAKVEVLRGEKVRRVDVEVGEREISPREKQHPFSQQGRHHRHFGRSHRGWRRR